MCTDCGGTVIEYDAAAGNGFCVQCGTVVEENTIVNEVCYGLTPALPALTAGLCIGNVRRDEHRRSHGTGEFCGPGRKYVPLSALMVHYADISQHAREWVGCSATGETQRVESKRSRMVSEASLVVPRGAY